MGSKYGELLLLRLTPSRHNFYPLLNMWKWKIFMYRRKVILENKK